MTGDSAARRAILTRIRAAQRTAVLTSVVEHSIQDDHQPAAADRTDLVTRVERELHALAVEVHRANSSEDVRGIVEAAVGDRCSLAWDASALPHDVFSVLKSPLGGSATRAEQAAAGIGITGCDAAVADTGSLVLLSGPGRSRTVSLLPPVHLAIVRSGDIVPTLGDAFFRLRERMHGSASCTVITGPSRTADIELTLTLGIHGPGRLVVIIAP